MPYVQLRFLRGMQIRDPQNSPAVEQDHQPNSTAASVDATGVLSYPNGLGARRQCLINYGPTEQLSLPQPP
jgi:hypothetical protein